MRTGIGRSPDPVRTREEESNAIQADSRLLISTLGNMSVTGTSGAHEDLLVFTPTQLGATTSGTWAIYFNGSDVGLSSTSNEDVSGAWVDADGKFYLTTLGSFGVTGVSGDGSDIIVCTPASLGSTTTCTWAMYWDGSANGFAGKVTDWLCDALRRTRRDAEMRDTEGAMRRRAPPRPRGTAVAGWPQVASSGTFSYPHAVAVCVA